MTTISTSNKVEDGQFDDAGVMPRDGPAYIDAATVPEEDLSWLDDDFEEEEDEYSDDDTYDENRVDDEDWENAERGACSFRSVLEFTLRSLPDFTKQYNRLRQHVAVRSGNAQGTQSSINTSNSVAPLPAVNHPSQKHISTPLTSSAKDKAVDQLAALSKFTSRIAGIEAPYQMGVGVNRKGPSATANMKDKADRATNEQVLDPRTRLILFKMIGRGVVDIVNGCVSTGKEVLILNFWYMYDSYNFIGQCLSRSYRRCSSSGTQDLQNVNPCV